MSTQNTSACTAAHPAKINRRLRRCRRCSPPLTSGRKNSKPDIGSKLKPSGRVLTASGVTDGPFAEAKENRGRLHDHNRG